MLCLYRSLNKFYCFSGRKSNSGIPGAGNDQLQYHLPKLPLLVLAQDLD
jgi:hypothetical protein